jgi:hypothetical protein
MDENGQPEIGPQPEKLPVVEDRKISLEAFKTGDCKACVYTSTCHYIDEVQSQLMQCPLLTKRVLKPTSTQIYVPSVREARKRWAGMQRLGIKVVA